ncbi:unnamed protein product [Mesocestoides corti]|uniref:DNA polymerase n=1 Tax=Mesocestoides corti TaxID=53468 RepID=A0A0R3UKK9_MESCO|nr:unnamed protein product [Mesocestoides corti]
MYANACDSMLWVITLRSPEYGQRISLQRQSSTDVEVDISACDILNRLEVAEDEAAFNPGLSFLWAEERARREALRNSGLISEEDQVVPTADVLLPLSGTPLKLFCRLGIRFTSRPNAIPVDNELDQIEQFARLVEERCSNLADGSVQEKSIVDSGSSQHSTCLSQRALDELCDLAMLSEESDAWLTSSIVSTPTSSLRSFLHASPASSSYKDGEVLDMNNVSPSMSPVSQSKSSQFENDAQTDAEMTLVASARASVSAYKSVLCNNDDDDGKEDSLEEERDDENLFMNLSMSAFDSTMVSEQFVEGEQSDNEDLFPSFLDDLTELPDEVAPSTSTPSRLPQTDGGNDTKNAPSPQQGRHQRRRRSLRLRLTASYLASPEGLDPPSVDGLGEQSPVSSRLRDSANRLRPKQTTDSEPQTSPNAAFLSSTPSAAHHGLKECFVDLSKASPDVVSSPNMFDSVQPVTPLRKTVPHSREPLKHSPLPPFQEEDDFLFDPWEDWDPTIQRFPPDATQVSDVMDSSQRPFEHHPEPIEPLSCSLGEPDFALHSSVYMTYCGMEPPSYEDVEAELLRKKQRLCKTAVRMSYPSTFAESEVAEEAVSQEAKSINKSLRAEIDLSTSLSGLWSQEQHKRRESLSATSTKLSASSLSISRRVYLPVQENHFCVASLELLVRTRRAHIGSSSSTAEAPRPLPRRYRGVSRTDGPAISISRLGGFYFPNAQLDPIESACVSFGGRSSVSFLLVVCSPSGKPLLRPLPKKCRAVVIRCENELEFLNWTVFLVQSFDPDLLVGFDVERRSWGYAVERAAKIGRVGFTRDISRLAPERLQCPSCRANIDFCASLTASDHGRVYVAGEIASALSCSCSAGGSLARRRSDWPCEPGAGRSGGPFSCPGRVVLCLWRVLQHELSLHEYSFETVALHVLKERVPRFTDGQLTAWMEDTNTAARWLAMGYWMRRAEANLRILERLDFVGRTSEFARVFGIEFFHVLSRGSQYRVESLLVRMARRLNFLLPSPSVVQRARQRAPETIPLTLEPRSGLHAEAPVVVLDFQSLYPSVAIAYNYCFSTAVGRLSNLVSHGSDEPFDFGCLYHSISTETLKALVDHVTVSPNGVVFVRPEIYPGILPRLWRSLLSSRLMVKDSLKLYSHHLESLKHLLDARQLGLKLIANVMYGYTAASFSGRMPCVEVGDSIVHKGRETLERAIQLVEGGEAINAPWAGSRVIYGDTDSLFVKLPPVGKDDAFQLGRLIADAVTHDNPAPIKLKLEKVYYPCLLLAKKRYVGYAYESAAQSEPIFDAKGIETVRRDHAPFVGEVLESIIRQIFDAFNWDTSPPDMPLLESGIRESVRKFVAELSVGKVAFSRCLMARPYRGQTGYRPGACAPALQIARRLMSVDVGREPAVGERVTYYVTPPPSPNSPLIGCVKAAEEAWLSAANRMPLLNLAFYIDHQLLPPLQRVCELLGWNVENWLRDMPRRLVRIKSNAMTSSQDVLSQSLRGCRRPSTIMRDFLKPAAHRPHLCLCCGDAPIQNGQLICCDACLVEDPMAPTKLLVRNGVEVLNAKRLPL